MPAYDIYGFYDVQTLTDGQWISTGKTHYRVGRTTSYKAASRQVDGYLAEMHVWEQTSEGARKTLEIAMGTKNIAHDHKFFSGKKAYGPVYTTSPHTGWQSIDVDWVNATATKRDLVRRYIPTHFEIREGLTPTID